MGSSPPGDRAFLIKHNYWETAGTLPLQSQACQVPCHSLQRLPGFCPPPNYVRGLELCFLTKPSELCKSDGWWNVPESGACLTKIHSLCCRERNTTNWAGASNAYQSPRETFLYSPGKVPQSHRMSWWDNLFTFCIKKKPLIVVWSTYKKLQVFNVRNLMCLEVSIDLWSHHHKQCHKHIHHFRSFLLPHILCCSVCYHSLFTSGILSAYSPHQFSRASVGSLLVWKGWTFESSLVWILIYDILLVHWTLQVVKYFKDLFFHTGPGSISASQTIWQKISKSTNTNTGRHPRDYMFLFSYFMDDNLNYLSK